MRRKRRNRGTWMPVLGHIATAEEEDYHYADIFIATTQVPTTTAVGGVNVITVPIVPDFTSQESAATADRGSSLHDRVTGNAWMLQRIVGKLHINCTSFGTGSAADIWNNVAVTAGFLVARADDSDVNQIELTPAEKDPQQVDNAQNPWIWRRTWILGNPDGDSNKWQPTSTAAYGSVADGPHVDSKVKRFIARDHRLWFVLQARGFDPRVFIDVNGAPNVQPGVGGMLDYRIYGSLRTQRNSSSF